MLFFIFVRNWSELLTAKNPHGPPTRFDVVIGDVQFYGRAEKEY
jgi:hypothetical protein